MINRFQVFVAALAGFLFCTLAGAQARNSSAVATAARAPVHARSTTRTSTSMPPAKASTGFQAGQQSNVITISPSGQIVSGFNPIVSTANFDGVPGLGFDYPHLAAVSAAFRNSSGSHLGRDGHRGQGAFVPIFFGGYPYYADNTDYDQAEQQPEQQAAPQSQQPQPQIIVIQQPVPAQQGSIGDAGNLSSTAAPDAQAELAVPDVGDFILVRRDGRILFASIFSVVGTQLRYVTPEGIRHTLAMADLDAAATEQMNEARGTTVQIRN